MAKKAKNSYPQHESGKHIDNEPEIKEFFYEKVRQGMNPYQAGELMGMGRSLVKRLLDNMKATTPHKSSTPLEVAEMMNKGEISTSEHDFPEPKEYAQLNDAAKRAYNDFAYFRQRYFNRRHVGWQVEMCDILMDWIREGQASKEADIPEVIKGIINTPPGGGKTTTITHDFVIWLICRNRNIRIGLGSRTTGQSEKYVRRARTTLEKNVLLNMEFGRFKPVEPELWRKDAFVVDGVQGHEASLHYKLAMAGFDPENPEVLKRLEDPNDEIHDILNALSSVFVTGEKEPTCSALSQDMGFLGGRFEVNLWDDLCDRSNSRTAEQREGLTEWWHAEAESRCEPGGIVALIGTRFGKYDLYRHCKELVYSTDDDLDEMIMKNVSANMTPEQIQAAKDEALKLMADKYGEDYELSERKSQAIYRYARFPAHDEDKCKSPNSLKNEDHIKCVLDPQRFTFRHIQKVQASDPRKFALTYQQLDDETVSSLVKEVWLTGGMDNDGFLLPGCFDYERKLLQIPNVSKDECYSIVTVDPSANNWWSIQWWIYNAQEDKDYLIDLLRIRLSAGNFLEWNKQTSQYRGIMEDWQKRSVEMGWPIALWIVEQNGAQRYLLQYKFIKEWMAKHKTLIKGHETSRNKTDVEYGVETLGPRYKQGLVNLPYTDQDLKTRVVVNEFKTELMEYPDGLTSDMVMGHWFLHFNRYSLPSSLKVGKNIKRELQHPYGDTMPDNMRIIRGS